MDEKIQLFVPTFDVEGCLDEIRECLERGWTGMGFKTVQFEEDWKKYTGLENAHYLNSATAGLNLAIDILKEENCWDDGDEIITTPFTFVSTNHAILLSKMKPVFADIDEYLCLSPESVEERITPKTKCVVFVGMGGNTGQLEKVIEICKARGISIILDAAHMAGTRYLGGLPGKDADVIVYSFQAVKNLPTADSGMICFQKKEYDAIARKKTWLGIDKDTYSRVDSEGDYKWRYDVRYVGHKYHGNSIMAAIGIVQLKHLDRDNAYRNRVSTWYRSAFESADETIGTIPLPPGCESSCHLFQIVVEKRNELLSYLNNANIFPGVHYIDNTQYEMYGYAKDTCPNAAYASDHVLSLPLHLRMTYADVKRVVENVFQFFDE